MGFCHHGLLEELNRETGIPRTLGYCTDSSRLACVSTSFLGKKKKEKGERKNKKRNKKQEKPQRFVARITFLPPVTTDGLSRLEFELREASLNQTASERSSMKEQQALEGEQQCPQEHEQQFAS